MTTQDRRQPAFADTDLMPFGKHRNESLGDVPARYLAWLWAELCKDGYNRATGSGLRGSTTHIIEKLKLANYIWNSQDAIALETGEKL